MDLTRVLVTAAVLAASGSSAAGVDILFMIPDRYGANYNFTRDRFESYGWTVTTAGVTETVEPCYGALPDLVMDTLITELEDLDGFDAIAICPATWRYQSDPYGDLIGCPDAISLIQEAEGDGKPVWAACVGPRVFAAADILDGVDMQGQPGESGEFMAEYIAAGANYLGTGLPPVIDGPVITVTRDQYYQSENCEAIGTVLASRGVSEGAAPGGAVESAPAALDGTLWTRTYGGSDADGGRAVCETSGGGFLITGYTWSSGAGESDVLLVMTDQEGVMLRSSAVGGAGYDCGNSVCRLADGGFAVAGSTTSSGAGMQDVFLIRLDSDGEVLWTRTYGGNGLEAGTSVCGMPDGGLALCGYTESQGSGENDVYLVRTDADGDAVWTRTYGGTGPETGDCVLAAPDGGLVVAGSTGSFTTNRDAFLLRIDPGGNLIWSDYYGAPGGEGGYDRACSVCILADGGFAMAGESNGEDNCGAFLVRTDSTGVEMVSGCYGGTFYDYGRSVVECADGGIISCGSIKDHDSCTNDIYLFKVNASGELVWESSLGAAGSSEWGCAVCPTSDGGYAVVGQTESYGAGSFDAWLVKVTDPAVGVEDPGIPTAGGLRVVPNPARDSVSFLGEDFQGGSVEIFDLAGRLVKAVRLGEEEPTMDVSDLGTGAYLVRISSDLAVSSATLAVID